MSSPKVRLGVAFDGEKEVKTAISNINAQLKTLSSEATKVKSAFAGQEKSEAALKATSKVLAQTLQTQKTKIDTLKKAVQDAAAHEEKWKTKISGTEKELSDEKAKLDAMKNSTSATTEEIKKQEKVVADLGDRLQKEQSSLLKANTNTEKWKKTLNEAETALNKTQKELDQTNSDLGQFSGKADKAGKEMDDMADSSQKVGKHLSTAGVALGTFIGNLATGALSKAAQAMKTLVTSTVQVGAEFDASMSKVAAVSGASGEAFDRLREKAREMGATTKFTAAESADAMNYMAMAGWKTDEMISGISGVMNLAAASGEDLATTSDIVTDALSAFGLKARDSGHFADILAAASSNANTNVSMMGETFKYAAPVAGALGYSAEDVAEAIGLMANSGIKASQAGTGLRTIMTKLSKDFTINSKELGKVKIATTNTDGSMRELSDILADARAAFGHLTESEKANEAQNLVGKNAMSAFLALMQAAPEDVVKLSDAIENCDGAAKNMANTMSDNLKGDIDKLKSAWQDLQIELFDSAKGPMRDVVQTVTNDMIPALKALVTGSEHTAGKIRNAFTGIMDKIGDFGGGLVSSFFGDKAGAAVKSAIGVITDSVKDLMGVLKDIGPIVGEILTLAGSLVKGLLPGITSLIRSLAPFVEKIVSVISVAAQSVLPLVSSVLDGIVKGLQPLMDAITPIFDVVGKIFEYLKPLFETIGQLIGAVFQLGVVLDPHVWLLKAIAPLLEAVFNLLKPIFDMIKMLADGLGWIVEGFLGLFGIGVDKKLEENRQALEDFAAECDTAREKIDGLKESQEEALDGINEEYEGYQKLIDELDGYIDKNGQVKDGYQARAEEIAGILKDQFGVEIELVDGTVQKWGELKNAALEEMKVEQLRAQINAGAELRQQASDAAWLSEQYGLVEEAQKKATDAQAAYNEAVKNNRNVEEAAEQLDIANRALYDSEKALGDAQKSLDDYDQAMAALASGNIKDVEASIESYNQKILGSRYLTNTSLGIQYQDQVKYTAQSAELYSKTGSTIYQTQAQNFYDQAVLARDFYEEAAHRDGEALGEWMNTQDSRLVHAKLISDEIYKASDNTAAGKRSNETYAKGEASTRSQVVKESRETSKQSRKAAADEADHSSAGEKGTRTQAEAISSTSGKVEAAAREASEDANAAGKDAANGAPAGEKFDSSFASGIAEKMLIIYNKAQDAARQANAGGKSVDSTSVGTWWAEGFGQGMQNKKGWLETIAANIAGSTATSAKNNLKINSPSKVMAKIGEGFDEGFALGIYNKEGDVIKASTKVTFSSIDAMRKEAEINSPSKKTKKLGQQLMDGLSVGASSRIQAVSKTMRNSVALVLKNAAKTVESYTKAGNYDGAGDRLLGLSSSGISSAGTATLKAVTKNLNTQFSAIKSTFNAQIKELNKTSNATIKSLNTKLKKEEKNSSTKLKNLEKKLDQAEKDRDKKLKDAEKTRNKRLSGADKDEKKRINSQYQAQKKKINEDYKAQKKALQNQIKAEKSRTSARQKALKAEIKEEEKAAKTRKTTLEKNLKAVADNQTKIVEAAKKAVTNEINSLTSYMEQQLDRISEKYQDKYDAIKAKNDALRSTLESSTSDRFTETTDRRGHSTVTLNSLYQQTQKIKEYMANLKAVRTQFTKYTSASVAQSMVDEIVGMGLDDGNKYMKALLGQTAAQLKAYASSYKNQLTNINAYTSTALNSKYGFYTADFKTIQAGYNKEIKALQNTITKKFTAIGQNAAKAFASGSSGAQNAVVKAIKSLGDSAIKQLKKTLGIKSPSRVFKEMGLMTDKGLAIGIDDNAKLAIDAVGRMSDNMISAMDGTSERLALSAGGVRALTRRQNMSAVQERPIVVITEIDGKQVGYATAKYVTRQQNFERRGHYA